MNKLKLIENQNDDDDDHEHELIDLPDCLQQKIIQNQNDDDDHEHGLIDLPDCLQHKILTNLPLKTIFIFKSVSKQWNSFISTPFFSKSYIDQKWQLDSSSSSTTLKWRPWTMLVSSKRGNGGVSVIDLSTNQPFLSIDDQLTFSRLGYYFERPDECYCGMTQPISSSNGLLLCHSGREYDIMYAICNPVTGQWITVPYKKFQNSILTEAFVTRVDQESSSKVIGYKVIRLHCGYFTKQFDMDIYDSDVKEWKKSELTFSEGFHVYSTRPVYLNGIVHWEGSSEILSKCIVAYDPYSPIQNQYRLLKLPTDCVIPGHPTAYTLLEVCDGKLQYAKIFSKSDGMAIWVLENYDEGEFELKHTIMFNEISTYRITLSQVHQCDTCKPLAFHPFDSNIIYLCTSLEPMKVLSYNIKMRTLSNLHLTMPVSFTFEMFPFVLPLWPPTVDRSLT